MTKKQTDKLIDAGFTFHEAQAIECGALRLGDFSEGALPGPAGTYSIGLKLTDAALYESATGRRRLKHHSIERWLNAYAEFARIRNAMASKGVAATLGSFVGR